MVKLQFNFFKSSHSLSLWFGNEVDTDIDRRDDWLRLIIWCSGSGSDYASRLSTDHSTPNSIQLMKWHFSSCLDSLINIESLTLTICIIIWVSGSAELQERRNTFATSWFIRDRHWRHHPFFVWISLFSFLCMNAL